MQSKLVVSFKEVGFDFLSKIIFADGDVFISTGTGMSSPALKNVLT